MGIKFELNQYHRNIAESDLLQDIFAVSKKLGKNCVTAEKYKQHGKYGVNTIRRKFGSWNSAIEKAGLIKTEQINNSEEELFENILNVWTKLGRQPRYAEISKPLSAVSIATYEKRFGGWRNALERFVVWANSEDKEVNEEVSQNNDPLKHKTKRDINLRLRFIVMQRDNFKCVLCGRSPATDPKVILHVDHIKAYSKGGETEIENLQTTCSNCNYGKSDL
jgi:predicted restriction endonuclease